MKGAAITHKGMEDVSAREIKELIDTKSSAKKTLNIFKINSLKDLCLLSYKGQTFIKILYLFNTFTFKKDFFDKLKLTIEKSDFGDFLKNKTFRTDCERHGKHEFSSQEVAKKSGEILLKKLKMKVDLKNPDLIFFIYIYNNNCYLGIDFSETDLSKRDYKIFFGSVSLKGTIGFSLLKLADYSKKDVLLDPLCGSGIIPIEAALYSSEMPVNYYRKNKLAFSNLKNIKDIEDFFEKIDNKIDLKTKLSITGFDNALAHVKQSQKNSKIAGINKKIKFSRIEIDWLDTKFKKESVEKVVSYLPSISRRLSEQIIKKFYDDFFYQMIFILKKTGSIVIAVRSSELLKKAAKKHNFKLEEEREVWHGQEKLKVLKFGKI